MNKELLLQIAESVGATHKQNLGVYQFFQDELHEFVEEIAKHTAKEAISEMIQQMWNYGIDESNNPSFYKAIESAKKTFGVEE
jgi:hypothetical protein